MLKFNQFIKKHWLFLVIFFFLLIWTIHSYFNHGIFYSLINSNTQEVLDYINSFGVFSLFIFVLIVILEVILAPIPPLILYIVAGLLFGGFYGGILVLLGNLIGAYIDFIIARNLFRKHVEKKIGQKLKNKFNRYFKKYGIISIFILRVTPLTSSDFVSYLAGLTNIRPIKFLVATTLGLTPLIFIQTYLGGGIIRNNPILVGITIFFSIIYLIIFLFLIIISGLKKNVLK
ncbi:MAG: VTT domain-containing protein [Candidatus Woesearchaeota archaeon]